MVKIPEPKAGLIIRYSYLWHREVTGGQEEGRKDRPCAIVVASKDGRVGVVPITTAKPSQDTPALELPASIGKQLGLGDKPSWIIAIEANVFRWPSSDIRRAKRDSWAYGQLPPNFTKTVIQGVRQQRERMRTVRRDEPEPKASKPKDWSKKVETSKAMKKAPKPSRGMKRTR